MVPPFCLCALDILRRHMKTNERLYEDTKRRIISLHKNGFLNNDQVSKKERIYD